VVLGAESSATLGTDGDDISDLGKKLSLIGDHALIGIAGFSGTGHQYEAAARAELEKPDRSSRLPKTGSAELALRIGKRTARVFRALDLEQHAAKVIKHLGREHLGEVLAFGVVAVLTSDGPCLMRITALGLTDCCEGIPYAVEGVGSVEALPFLRYIRHHVWKNRDPDVGIGILSVLWAMRYALLVNPDKLKGPRRIGVVELVNGRSVARVLSNEELIAHDELLDEFESEAIGKLLQRRDEENGSPPPTPSIY
jgi:20S proteasome alpha/beta subunit